jgi:hypothetical protein
MSMDALSVGSTALGFLGGIFSNPKDKLRAQETDQLKARALAGDDYSYWKLRCLSGDTSAKTRENAIRVGFVTSSDGPCGYATDTAKGYAKAALAEVDLRRGAATVAGQVASGAAQVGVIASPDAFLGTVGANVGAQYGISPLLLIGAGVVLVLVLAKRGK